MANGPKTSSGFVVANPTRTRFIARDDNDVWLTDNILRAYIWPTVDAAAAYADSGPATTDYWGDVAVARLLSNYRVFGCIIQLDDAVVARSVPREKHLLVRRINDWLHERGLRDKRIVTQNFFDWSENGDKQSAAKFETAARRVLGNDVMRAALQQNVVLQALYIKLECGKLEKDERQRVKHVMSNPKQYITIAAQKSNK